MTNFRPGTSDIRPATDRQISYIHSLITKVYGADSEYHAKIDGMTINAARASEMIGNLKAKAPATPKATKGFDASTLAGGYYAVRDPQAEKLRFLRIKVVRDASSKWNGWVFVEEQASDELHKAGSQKPGQAYQGRYADLLAEIAKDEPAAMALYGKEIGQCGRCGRTLTDEVSRAFGLGPECRGKLGL